MESVRAKRKLNSELLAAALKTAEQEKQKQERQAAALSLAIEVLREEPRALVESELHLEYVDVQLFVSRGTCRECHATIFGREKELHFCSACGARFVTVQRENDPYRRFSEAAIDRAVNIATAKGVR